MKKDIILNYIKDFIIIFLQSLFLMFTMVFLHKVCEVSLVTIISVLSVCCVIPVYFHYKDLKEGNK